MTSPYRLPLVSLANAARSRSRSLTLPFTSSTLRLVCFLEREGLLIGHLRLSERRLLLHLPPSSPPLLPFPLGNRPLSAGRIRSALGKGRLPPMGLSTSEGLRTGTEAALLGVGGVCLFLLPL